jgi:hypothetical protein
MRTEYFKLYQYLIPFIMTIMPISVLAQYEGLDSTRRQIKYAPKANSDTLDAEEIQAIRYSDIEFKGLDFTIFGSGSTFQLEFAPFTGIHINERIYLAGGGYAALYSRSNSSFSNESFATINVGCFAFARVSVNSLFLHAEYRYQNSLTDLSPRTRSNFGIPIIGIGYNYEEDMGSYGLIGFALNPDSYLTSPFGPIVYRIGFRF